MSGENPISPDPNPSGVIAWPSAAIKTNVGVNYDPVTGLYTAPYDGTYAFHVNLYKKPGPNDGVYCRIVMDSTTLLADVNIVLTAGRLVGSASTIVHLVQGDTVAVVCIDFNRVDAYSSWMGFLVMAD